MRQAGLAAGRSENGGSLSPPLTATGSASPHSGRLSEIGTHAAGHILGDLTVTAIDEAVKKIPAKWYPPFIAILSSITTSAVLLLKSTPAKQEVPPAAKPEASVALAPAAPAIETPQTNAVVAMLISQENQIIELKAKNMFLEQSIHRQNESPATSASPINIPTDRENTRPQNAAIIDVVSSRNAPNPTSVPNIQELSRDVSKAQISPPPKEAIPNPSQSLKTLEWTFPFEHLSKMEAFGRWIEVSKGGDIKIHFAGDTEGLNFREGTEKKILTPQYGEIKLSVTKVDRRNHIVVLSATLSTDKTWSAADLASAEKIEASL